MVVVLPNVWAHIVLFVKCGNVVAAVSPPARMVVEQSRSSTHHSVIRAGALVITSKSEPLCGGLEERQGNRVSCYSIHVHSQAPSQPSASSTEDVQLLLACILRLSCWWWRQRYAGLKVTAIPWLLNMFGHFDELLLEGGGDDDSCGSAVGSPWAVSNIIMLHCGGCAKLADVSHIHALAATLVSVNVSYTAIDDGALVHIARIAELQFLDLSRCQRLVDVSPLAAAVKLRQLILAGCLSVVDTGVARLSTLVQLEYVSLNVCKLLSNVNCFTAAPHLQELQCAHTRVDTQGSARLNDLCELKVLCFANCERLTSVNEALSSSICLKKLTLSGTSIDDVGLDCLRRSCPSLASLSLCGCIRVTSLCWAPHTLIELDVSRCQISDSGLPFVAQLFELEEVNLSHNIGITNVASLGYCTAIRRMDLSFTGIRNADSMMAWERSGNGLRYLRLVELEGCPFANRHELANLFHRMQLHDAQATW